MKPFTISRCLLTAVAVSLLMGCGPSRAEREETERAQEWLETLQRAAHAAYSTQPSGKHRECLGRHVFDVDTSAQWPANPDKEFVFSLRHSYNVKEVNKIEVDNTRVAVIFDPNGSDFDFQHRALDLDRKNALDRQASEVATARELLLSPHYAESKDSFEKTIRDADMWIAHANLDHRFDTGLRDSLGVWSADPERLRKNDPHPEEFREKLTAYVYRKPWLHIFEQTGRADQPEANRARMRAFLKRFRARAEFEIPTEPGLCIPYAFLADDGTLPFLIKLGMRYPDALGVTYTFDMGYLTPDTEGGGPLFDSLGVAA
ncbi:hypothetical protein AB4Z27_29175, partial [Cupriavidus sp. KB_39]